MNFKNSVTETIRMLSYKKTIEEGDAENFNDPLDCGNVEDDVHLILDDEALINNNQQGSIHYHQKLFENHAIKSCVVGVFVRQRIRKN